MKGFTKLATSNPCNLVLSKRRSSICGPLSTPCVHFSTTTTAARRLSVDVSTTTRRLSVDLSTARRVSVDSNPINTKYFLRRSSADPSPLHRINAIPEIQDTFPREITWLAGAPGAGKGTNSTHIAQVRGYQAPTIVMSSLLESPECKRIKDAGGMVDDETVQRALLKELAKPEYRDGVVVDGFPRTEKQAAWLRSLHRTLSSTPYSSTTTTTNFNFVMLFIDEEASVARQLSRGEVIRQLNLVRSANKLTLLEERATDVSDVAARVRYSNFLQQFEAINTLSEHFSLSVVDASAPIETIRQRISAACSITPKPTSTSALPQTTLSPMQRQFDSLADIKIQSNSYSYL